MKPPFRLAAGAVLGFLLGACSSVPQTSAPLTLTSPAALTGTTVPAGTFTSPPADTASPLPTETISVPFTPGDTPTASLTPTPSGIPRVYVFPVQPLKDVGFSEGGHPYPATDIFALEGDRFVAVTDGVVDFVSYKDEWDPLVKDMSVAGGLCVAIVGDDGVRYYGSHLSAIAPGIRAGVRVKAGRLLGLVGHTGNAITTPPHVHFGISRPTYPEDWKRRRGEVDPYFYLLAWKKGFSVTPVLSNLPPLP